MEIGMAKKMIVCYLSNAKTFSILDLKKLQVFLIY
jgi:hypothetical protein